MAVFDEIITEIKNILTEDTSLSNISFIDAYRVSNKANPIQKNYVSICLKGVDIKDRAVGNYLGLKNGQDCFGKNATVLVKLKIYSPKTTGGINTTEVFSKICNALFASEINNQIASITCSDINFDGYSDAFVVDSVIKLNVVIGDAKDESAISSIVVRRDF